MKTRWCVLLSVCLILLSLFGSAQAATTPAKAIPPAPTEKAVAASVETRAAPVERLTLRQRLDMGLTLGNMIQAAKELKKAGQPVTAEAIASHIAESKANGKAIANAIQTKAVNWDNILAFVEKLLPLVLQIIQMFAVDQPTLDYQWAAFNPALLITGPLFYRSSCSGCSEGSCQSTVAVTVKTEVKAAPAPITAPPAKPTPCRQTPAAKADVTAQPKTACSPWATTGERVPWVIGQFWGLLFGSSSVRSSRAV